MTISIGMEISTSMIPCNVVVHQHSVPCRVTLLQIVSFEILLPSSRGEPGHGVAEVVNIWNNKRCETNEAV